MIYIGIDPGDRWCGAAFFMVPDREFGSSINWLACTRVYDTNNMAFYDLVERLMFGTNNGSLVVTETFRMRPAGHQSWNAGLTLQTIGAIRYVCAARGNQWAEVPAADPAQLARYPLGKYVDSWRPRWPKTKNKNWNHGLSAWRILSAYLAKYRPEFSIELKRRPLPSFGFIEISNGLSEPHLLSPTSTWHP